MTDKKNKKKQLTDAELKKASGGLRGPGSLPAAGGMEERNEATPTRMPNRPINISRRVQGNWSPTSTQSGDADEIDERP